MKITALTFRIIEIPMNVAVKHALAERSVAKNVVLTLTDEHGNAGWGECCPRDYVTGETLESVQTTLLDKLGPEILEQSFDDVVHVQRWIKHRLETVEKDQLAAFCALELALIDLSCRHFNTGLDSFIGSETNHDVRYSGVIATDEPEAVAKMATMMKQSGLTHVKVKLVEELARNRAILEVARQVLGSNVELRGDANAAWTPEQAIEQLNQLSEFGLKGIEQPVSATPPDGMSMVTQHQDVPVVADESLCSFDDAKWLADKQGCDIYNIRVSKCGGLMRSQQLIEFARSRGLRCQLGAQVGETVILSAAGQQLAKRNNDLVWHEGCYGKFLLAQDIGTPDLTIGSQGRTATLFESGLGFEIDMALLDNATIVTQKIEK